MAKSITPSGFSPQTCAECQRGFTPARYAQSFCTKTCKDKARNREMLRGREVYRALYAWRSGYGKNGSGAFMGYVTALVDEWRKEDRETGTPPPLEPVDWIVKRSNTWEGQRRRKEALREAAQQ